MAKERMFSTSIQLSETQLDRLDKIRKIKETSNAVILRDAFDFYVSTRFPNLLNESN